MQAKVLFTIFNAQFTVFGLMCALGFALLCGIMIFCTKKREQNINGVLVFGIIALPMIVVISRLFYVLANIMYYGVALGSILPPLRFWEGGYSMLGAIIAVFAAAAITDKIYSTSSSDKFCYADACAVGLPFAIAVERLAEAHTGTGLGKVMLTPWLKAIAVPDDVGTLVHPTYMYEFAFAIITGIIMLVWLIIRGKQVMRHDVVYTFMTLFGSTQLVLESLRNDNHMVIHFVRVQQILSLMLMLFALIMWARQLAKHSSIKKSQFVCLALIYVICIAVCVMQEFAVDSSENPWMDYGIMAFSSFIMCSTTLSVGRLARKLRSGRRPQTDNLVND